MKPQILNLALHRTGRLMFCLALICAGMRTVAQAHDPGLSSATVTIQPERIQVELIFSKVDAAILLKSFANNDEMPDAKQLAAGLEKFAADSLELELDGQIVSAKSVRSGADEFENIMFSLVMAAARREQFRCAQNGSPFCRQATGYSFPFKGKMAQWTWDAC